MEGVLRDLVVILGAAAVALFICHRLRIPTILGFLGVGIVAGPFGFALVSHGHEVEVLAEIGVVLLLFTIGLEISPSALLRLRRSALGGGLLQVLTTLGAGTGVFLLLGNSLAPAIFFGAFCALSSTAIALKTLEERGEMDAPHGRLSLGILLFQDLAVVPLMLMVPWLAGAGATPEPGRLLVSAAFLAVIVASRWAVPWILFQVARTRDRELFLFAVISICLAIALMTYLADLSLALGAFLAGLIISNSEYSHEALAAVLPLRRVFTAFFFVSVGMLLNVGLALDNWHLVVPLAVGTMILKAVLVAGIVVLLGYPIRPAVMAGLAISQIGEFSLLLLASGQVHGVIDERIGQILLAASTLTMALTPLVMAGAPFVAGAAGRLVPRRDRERELPGDAPGIADRLMDHIIILGFGPVGRHLAQAAKSVGLPFVVLEMNPETVRQARSEGVPILYGDAVDSGVLDRVGVLRARVLVAAISDSVASRTAVAKAKEMNPTVHVIVRTRFAKEVEPLLELGADQVVPEDFESSIEIFTRVLTRYLIPKSDVEAVVGEIRAEGYQALRAHPRTRAGAHLALDPSGLEINTLRVAEGAPLAGKTLAESNLRRAHRITVLAVKREGELLPNPDGDLRLEPQDVIVVLGAPDDLVEGARLVVPA